MQSSGIPPAPKSVTLHVKFWESRRPVARTTRWCGHISRIEIGWLQAPLQLTNTIAGSGGGGVPPRGDQTHSEILPFPFTSMVCDALFSFASRRRNGRWAVIFFGLPALVLTSTQAPEEGKGVRQPVCLCERKRV